MVNDKNKKLTIELNPFQQKPIIGIRIVDKEYADSLAKGIIHFTNPSVWRDPGQCSGLQLDLDDGCFCSSLVDNDEALKDYGRVFIKEVRDGLHKYYEKKDYLAGCCFFGIKQSNFKDSKQQYGVKIIESKELVVQKEFFDNFIDNEKCNKKVVVFFDMWDVIDRIIKALIKLGCEKEEIFFGNVYYVNKTLPYASVSGFPFEYLLKDEKFKNQSEFRIIVLSSNKNFWIQFKNNNFNLDIGDISSKTTVQDYYQKDLYFSIQGNRLLYSLATPIVTTGKEISFSELIGAIYQLLQNMLPGLH